MALYFILPLRSHNFLVNVIWDLVTCCTRSAKKYLEEAGIYYIHKHFTNSSNSSIHPFSTNRFFISVLWGNWTPFQLGSTYTSEIFLNAIFSAPLPHFSLSPFFVFQNNEMSKQLYEPTTFSNLKACVCWGGFVVAFIQFITITRLQCHSCGKWRV